MPLSFTGSQNKFNVFVFKKEILDTINHSHFLLMEYHTFYHKSGSRGTNIWGGMRVSNFLQWTATVNRLQHYFCYYWYFLLHTKFYILYILYVLYYTSYRESTQWHVSHVIANICMNECTNADRPLWYWNINFWTVIFQVYSFLLSQTPSNKWNLCTCSIYKEAIVDAKGHNL